jgi:hypothetical protein
MNRLSSESATHSGSTTVLLFVMALFSFGGAILALVNGNQNCGGPPTSATSPMADSQLNIWMFNNITARDPSPPALSP